MKRIIITALLLVCSLSGCGTVTYDEYVIPEQEYSALEPADDHFNYNDYSKIAPLKETTDQIYSSEDGLCVIEKKQHYYDVSLDLESGDHYNAGKVYAETLLEADPDYEKKADQYINESMKASLLHLRKSQWVNTLQADIDEILKSLPKAYSDEIRGFAEKFGPDKDISPDDGVLSEYEALLLQLTPDLFIDCIGNAVSVGGNRTESHKQISAFISESYSRRGDLLSEDHCVLRFLNGEKSVISVSTLGIMNIKTAVNSNGVFVGLLSAFSAKEYDDSISSSCTFLLRQVLESCDTAEKTGRSFLDSADRINDSYSVFISDVNSAYTAEISCKENIRNTFLRDETSTLIDGIFNDCDDCMFAVNRLVADGMPDEISKNNNKININFIRWTKFNDFFSGNEMISLPRFKDILTCESNEFDNVRLRNKKMVNMVIADHGTRTIQAEFVDSSGVYNTPVFFDLGKF